MALTGTFDHKGAMALPIEDVLEDVTDALRREGRAVLQAPPGAGKTTRVPLALLEADLGTGRIVMLEPRRLAARAAAARMAETLGEPVGRTVGYRMRGDSKVSDATRIEVVTEGLLTRRLQADPGLEGVDIVIFDEFHERSLNADLGLALTWEVRQALRPDLEVLVMSATLDAGPVAEMLDGAPVVTSDGRMHPVTPRWLPRPLPAQADWEAELAALCISAMEEGGSGLAFLPGEGEIRRVAARLAGRLPGVEILPLFGAMDLKAQRQAVAYAGRKLVLATAIAETSLTLDGITQVIDGGRARRARFDPGSGMSRLVTERITKAEATQRAGRAGRLGPGVCWKLWAKAEEGAMAAFPAPEIAQADLAALALTLADWGADEGSLAFLTAPPAAALAEARALLLALGALDQAGHITAQGRAMAALPVHPRLAAMLVAAGPGAADLAALLSDRDPLARNAPVDLALRLDAVRGDKGRPADPATLARIRTEARRLRALTPQAHELPLDEALALAFPDRIARRRPSESPRYGLSGGKGVILPEDDALGQAEWLVVAETDGAARDARVRLALATSRSAIRAAFADRLETVESCHWDRRADKVVATRSERLGAIALAEMPWTDAAPDSLAKAMCDGVRALGLGLSDDALRFCRRVTLARPEAPELPDCSEPVLLDTLETWLMPYLQGVTSAADWARFDAFPALRARLDWEQSQMLDRIAPAHFITPLGRKVPIDYGGEAPEVSLRLQELFGQTTHPSVAGRPLRLVLLSPAGRPIQVTMDLAGFWTSSYADVRKDMRGRYPKHPWPEDPTQADPTLRTKRRM